MLNVCGHVFTVNVPCVILHTACYSVILDGIRGPTSKGRERERKEGGKGHYYYYYYYKVIIIITTF